MKFIHVIAATALALSLAACTKPTQVQPDAGAQAPATTTGSAATGLGNEAGAAGAGTSSAHTRPTSPSTRQGGSGLKDTPTSAARANTTSDLVKGARSRCARR